MAQPTGIHARRAALKLLDAVLRRGETLEQAGGAALRDVRDANDQALARAIAGEALRWLTDLDAAIDSATRQPLSSAETAPRAVIRRSPSISCNCPSSTRNGSRCSRRSAAPCENRAGRSNTSATRA